MKRTLKTQYLFIGLFFLGLVVGSITVNLLFHGVVELENLWNVDMLDVNGMDLLMKHEYFIYIIMKRAKQFIFVFFLMEFIKKEFVLGCVAGGMGFAISALISLETMRLGMQGVLLSIVYFIPHYIIYIGIIIVFIVQTANKWNKPLWLRLLIVIGFVLVGSFLEAYINPLLLRFMFAYIA